MIGEKERDRFSPPVPLRPAGAFGETMNRSGYTDDCEDLKLYRASVERAIRGERGQAFLMELAAEMDAQDEKILIEGALIDEDGDCCAIGVVCKARGLDVSTIDIDDPESVGGLVGIARSLAAEIEFENDEDWYNRGPETPSQRWVRMRKWVDRNLLPENRVRGGDRIEADKDVSTGI